MRTYHDYDGNLLETGKQVSQSESETRVICDPSISRCNRPSLGPTRCIDGRTHSPLSSFAVIFFSLSSTYPARLFSPAANQFSFVSDPTSSSSSSAAPQLRRPVYANKTRRYRCFVITAPRGHRITTNTSCYNRHELQIIQLFRFTLGKWENRKN